MRSFELGSVLGLGTMLASCALLVHFDDAAGSTGGSTSVAASTASAGATATTATSSSTDVGVSSSVATSSSSSGSCVDACAPWAYSTPTKLVTVTGVAVNLTGIVYVTGYIEAGGTALSFPDASSVPPGHGFLLKLTPPQTAPRAYDLGLVQPLGIAAAHKSGVIFITGKTLTGSLYVASYSAANDQIVLEVSVTHPGVVGEAIVLDEVDGKYICGSFSQQDSELGLPAPTAQNGFVTQLPNASVSFDSSTAGYCSGLSYSKGLLLARGRTAPTTKIQGSSLTGTSGNALLASFDTASGLTFVRGAVIDTSEILSTGLGPAGVIVSGRCNSDLLCKQEGFFLGEMAANNYGAKQEMFEIPSSNAGMARRHESFLSYPFVTLLFPTFSPTAWSGHAFDQNAVSIAVANLSLSANAGTAFGTILNAAPGFGGAALDTISCQGESRLIVAGTGQNGAPIQFGKTGKALPSEERLYVARLSSCFDVP